MKSNFFLISPTCGRLQLDCVDVDVALHAAAGDQSATFGSEPELSSTEAEADVMAEAESEEITCVIAARLMMPGRR